MAGCVKQGWGGAQTQPSLLFVGLLEVPPPGGRHQYAVPAPWVGTSQATLQASPLHRCLPLSSLSPPSDPAATPLPACLPAVFEYLSDSPLGLYGSIPLLLAHNAERTLGAFWCA